MATSITDKQVNSFSLRQRDAERRRIAKAAMSALIRAEKGLIEPKAIAMRSVNVADELMSELDKVVEK